MKVGGQYYIETDYSKFKKLSCNRMVTRNRLGALIESFKGGVVLTLITVNKNMEIIDGQGRFEARKALGLPILYVIDPDTGIDDCRRINAANKPWSSEDYVISYAESGNENYQNLLDCRISTGFPFARCLRLANRASGERKTKSSYSSGNQLVTGILKFTKEDRLKVEKLKVLILEIAEALGKTESLNDAFYTGCKIAIETNGYDHQRMLASCKAYQMQYTQMSSLEDELKMLSKVYNYRRSASNKLYFEDYMRNRGSHVRNYKYVAKSDSDNDDVSTLKKKKGGLNGVKTH